MPGQQHVCAKPLSGRVFYLDLPSNRRAQALENDITLLGGTVEKFFSKEIRYLVSNKREAKYVERLRRELAVPSPDSGPSSPFPRQTVHQPAGGQKARLKCGSQGQVDSVAKSRGKSLVERVVKEQERIQMNKTLSDALEWGVKVLYIDDVITYVEKRKKLIIPSQPVTSAVKKRTKPESKPRPGFPKSQAQRINTPFIKVEDTSRHYRPIYAAMSKMPEINMAIAPPCTPFCGDKKDQHKNGHSEEWGHGRAKKNRAKKQVGFCECCMLQYDNLVKHVQSESHRAFSKGNEYSVLDRLVSTMHCDLALFKPKNKRPKCSVSSTMVVQGPYWTALHKPPDASATERRWKPYNLSTAAGGREASHRPAMEPIPGSVKALSGEESTLRNLDGSSAQPLPRHTSQTCRADSVRGQTAAQSLPTPTPQVELAPPRGSSPAVDSARLSRLSRTRARALPQYHKEFSQSGCSSRTFPHSHSLQKTVCESILGSPSERPEEEPLSQEQEKETCIPESQGIDLPDQRPSTVRTIQRKVKVQKRKRRRVDMGSGCHYQASSACDVPDEPLFGLLFQSSDSVDLDFLGFDDGGREVFTP
ncbi:unnamed protein product [Arctogadus glacialis]